MELLNTTAAQTAFAIGDARIGISPALSEFTAKIAHAVAACAVGAGRAAINNGGSGNGCSEGAIGAVVGSLTADFMLKNGKRDSTSVISFSQLIGGIASATTGGGPEEINIAAQAGANVAANNELLGSTDSIRLYAFADFIAGLWRCLCRSAHGDLTSRMG